MYWAIGYVLIGAVLAGVVLCVSRDYWRRELSKPGADRDAVGLAIAVVSLVIMAAWALAVFVALVLLVAVGTARLLMVFQRKPRSPAPSGVCTDGGAAK